MTTTGDQNVRRRSVLWLAFGTAAALVGRARAETAAASAMLDWDHFLAQAPPALTPLARDESSEAIETYRYALAALVGRLSGAPRAKLGALPGSKGVYMAPIHRGVPFVVLEWQLDAGAVLRPHNHPHYSVCTLGLEGEARMRHYEPAANAPPFESREPFRVGLTRELVLRPRTLTALSPGHDNIHTFAAGPAGARGVDVFTLHGKDVGFSYLDIAPQPLRAGGDEFEARWTGM